MAAKDLTATEILERMLVKHSDIVMDEKQLAFVKEAMRAAVFQLYIDTSLGDTPEARTILREYNKYIFHKSRLLGFGMENNLGLYG